MLDSVEVKTKLDGKDVHWYFGYDSDKWRKIVPKIKLRLLRSLWEVSLWDRLSGRDIPRCDRCKGKIEGYPHYVLTFPLCECCYDDFHCEALNDHD